MIAVTRIVESQGRHITFSSRKIYQKKRNKSVKNHKNVNVNVNVKNVKLFNVHSYRKNLKT